MKHRPTDYLMILVHICEHYIKMSIIQIGIATLVYVIIFGRSSIHDIIHVRTLYWISPMLVMFLFTRPAKFYRHELERLQKSKQAEENSEWDYEL